MDALSEILDVIGSYPNQAKMFQAVMERHGENADAQAQAEEDAIFYGMRVEAEQNGMTVEDWILYQDMMQEYILPIFDGDYEQIIANFVESAFNEETLNQNNNERGRDNDGVQQGVHREGGLSDGGEAGVGILQTERMDDGSRDSGSVEAGQGGDVQAVEQSIDDIPATEVSGRAEEVKEKTISAPAQEADISDEDIAALWIKSRDELWKPNDELGQMLHEKLYEAHPEAHQPEERKKVVRHLIEAVEKHKDHPIAKEVLKYVKYPTDEQILFRGGEKSVQEEVTETIFATAKEKFGTTYDMREAGYILPDGSMLDFSGKHEIRGADTSFLNGQRSVDHRAIQEIAYDFDENKTGVETDMGDFLDRGAIRIDYNTGAINLNVAPTKAQKDRLKRLIERNDGDVYIDFGKGWDTEHYVEYESARASRVLADIDRYFNEGIKPSENIRFRSAEPAPVFYSNAEYAVKAVKQEKATPEQWLKMIEKNGGLKAGEDKWLGLSDWLKSSDKKTLTKQEVLDFIKENQIQIEEVVYGDIEDNPKFKELEKEYQSYYAETYDSDVAFQRMVDKYGEEFDVAFNGSGMNLYPRNEYGSEDAQKYLGVNEINSTRRQYTTDGLDNKREIALTVPTIESWNESDEIHFGDAGNGRAIAWVRFGETTIPIKEIKEVKEFQEPRKSEMTGREMYAPIGTTNSKDYVVYGKMRTGDMAYVVFIGERPVSKHNTLEEARSAMNEYYKEHKHYILAGKERVLVIDEVQSKRHQEGREKGYRDEQLEKDIVSAKKLVEDTNKALGEYKNGLKDKYDFKNIKGSFFLRHQIFYDSLSNDDRAQLDVLAEERNEAERNLDLLQSKVKGIPNAPFE
jgi:hypothetical protein